MGSFCLIEASCSGLMGIISQNKKYALMDKETMVQKMFSSAARRYDLNNTVLSFGRHHYWKKYAIQQSCVKEGDIALDICTGTADMAILLCKHIGPGGHVMAVDLNPHMLEIGRRKVRKYGLSDRITCLIGNAEFLQFKDNTFSATTVGFGIRNVKNLEKALYEMMRVTKPGGRVVVLEFTHPVNPLFRRLYDFYSFTLLPVIGTIIARDRTGIYKYLPKSIRKFPPAESLKNIMLESGFSRVNYIFLSGGIVAVHVGIK